MLRFRQRVPCIERIVAAATDGRVIGIEREYEVHTGDTRVDAQMLWPTLRDVGVALDPGDPRARRGSWGGVLTADGREAEVAIPPVRLGPGAATNAVVHAALGEGVLRDALSPDHRLAGYSTHVSVEVDDRRVAPIAHLVACRLAVPLMLALDRRTSPGLLVRPRYGRLEVGGEFAAGAQLQAAAAFTIALVELASRAQTDRRLRARLPRPEVRVDRACERYGWYVDRRAFGSDLYERGRAARIRCARGSWRAGDLLMDAWELAREDATMLLDDAEVHLVDDVVAGELPIPLECPVDDDGPVPASSDRGRDYGPRRRTAFDVAVAAATWTRAVLHVRAGERCRWLSIPGRALDPVLDAIDGGDLDEELAGLVRSAGRPTRLVSREETSS